MKNCACIAEYNPLHTGHLRLIDHIRRDCGAETLTVVMSGDFCERGEGAVLDKYARAKHAVYAGADLVIELPAVFATANAELFATGSGQNHQEHGRDGFALFRRGIGRRGHL